MKRMSEILEIMYEYYCNYVNSLKIDGLCNLTALLLDDGKITSKERYTFIMYLYENKPKNLNALKYKPFFWKPYKVKPRKRYLKKHIKKNKKLEEKEEL